uniref:Uncharacterized protein n=1 Tax=Cannabis sativa TaxID=3483 RepID=A0A803QSX5_CANSA
MGNIWFGKNKGFHPINDDRQRKTTTNNTSVTIKVRMRATEFRELVAQVDMDLTKTNNANSELGWLILQHCLQGKNRSPMDVDRCRLSQTTIDYRRLSTICEEEEEKKNK